MIITEPPDLSARDLQSVVKEKPERLQLSPTEKLSKVKGVLAVISGTRSLLISGSLAQQIIRRLQDGKCELRAEDVGGIHDIDLAVDLSTNSSPTAALERLAPLNSLIFEIEQNMAQYSCLGESSLRNMAVQQVNVVIEEGAWDVLYTTPEFLLLTCVGSGITSKTPTEKYRRKIKEIPSLPGFSREKFTALARYEIEARPNSDEAKRIKKFLTES